MTKLTKGIAKLKNEIEKQARELNQRYPNPTHDSSFVSDPLWKKQVIELYKHMTIKDRL